MPKPKSLFKRVNIEIDIKSKKWLQIKNIEELIVTQSNKLIELSPLKKYLYDIDFELAIMLCSNPQIKKINQQFRNINKPTNILSFANLDEKLIQMHGLDKAINSAKYVFLGDLVLSYDYIFNEANKDNKNFNEHLTHLIIHGILHLIGYDHIDSQMAHKMESLEIKILNKLGIENPYLK